MKYFQTSKQFIGEFTGRGEGPNLVNSLRFARDSIRVAAGLAIVGGLAVEVIGDSPAAHGGGALLAIAGLGLEAGAQLVNDECRRIVHSSQSAEIIA